MLVRIAVMLMLLAAFGVPCSISFFKAPYHKDRRSDTPLFRFEEHGHAGFINADGKVVIPPKFDIGWSSEEDFVEGLSPARVGENWGFIDSAGDWAIQPKYSRVQAFSEGLAAVTYQRMPYDSAAYIDRSGKAIIEFHKGVTDAGPFSEGLAAVRTNGYTGLGKLAYIDRSGTVVIPYEFALGGRFHEGLAAVVFDGRCYIEERDGLPRSPPPSVPAATSCGGVPNFITERCGEGFIDKAGKIVFRFQGARDFSEGLAAVEKDGKWGFIEPDGRFRVQPAFEAVRSYNGGLAATKYDGKWGYLDRASQWVIRPQFASADDFSDGLALTEKGYVDRAGNRVAVAKDGTAFVLGLAHVTFSENKFGYINHRGKVVFRYRSDAVKPSMLPYSEP
ncbi:MAG: WG repeat-containing protein [Bryobacteraceae bacterium]